MAMNTLQVWDDKDVLAIVKANQEKYPYTLSGLHNETQELLQSSKTNRPRCLELGVLVMAIRTVANGVYEFGVKEIGVMYSV